MRAQHIHSISYTAMLSLGALTLGLMGCDKPVAQQAAAGGPAMPPPEVAVVEMSPEQIVLSTELPGRTSAFLDAEVRPQVSGILIKRHFEEGEDVEEGQLLYEIDPARYEAAYERAKASLVMAEAEVPALKSRVERYQNAVGERAVSQQNLDDATAELAAAEATITARQAEVRAAKIDLDYTKITAPISGRIGKSDVTVGALVTANQPNALATIREFDPIYVDVAQSSSDLLRLRRELEQGHLKAGGDDARKVSLRLEDGDAYPLEGELKFRDITVDPTTGSYTLRVVFPNPDHVLLPGMYVRAVVQEGVLDSAILVPQQGVSRTPKGEPVALVVDKSGTVQQRMLVLDRAVGNRWLVDEGLEPGDRVVVEGAFKVRPGAQASAVAFEANGKREEQSSDGEQLTSK